MREAIPLGPIIGAIVWLIIIPVLLIVILREYKKRFLGEKKDSISGTEDKFLKEIKESYTKLTEEQKRKVDNIK